ncbi:hypothetical protein [Microbacterium sp. 179-I 3D3 NHS]|uniref:hypothetical protein n=1 Tax=unclassified Microbacterium TaxID=2609290 RepID=UPI00399F92AB
MNTIRTAALTLSGAVLVTAALAGCAPLEEAWSQQQTGEIDLAFDTAAEAAESPDSFRFQGLLPDDATDIELVAERGTYATVIRWTSAAPFESVHCTPADVDSEPTLSRDWIPATLPDTGTACGTWTVVDIDDEKIAWTGPDDS